MRLSAITTAAVLVAGMGFAAETVAPDNVVFEEYGEVTASLTGVPGDAEKGRDVFVTRGLGNCLACHAVQQLEDVPFHGEVGPELTWTGESRTAEELRGIVSNAKMSFPDTVMPAFYKVSGFTRPGDGYTGKAAKEIKPILSAQQIEDVVAFLLTLKEE